MKQRLGIGRAIIHDPLLLILDEPAAGLDPKARVELKELLRSARQRGKTIFITSHILSDLEEICTSIGIIENGRLLRVGPLEEVMRDGRTFGAYESAWLQRARSARGSPRDPIVTDVRTESAGADFSFSGSDAELAELVRALVAEGLPVCGVQELSEKLEELYLRISSGEAS